LPTGTWHQAFGDEFDGSSLDTAKWGLVYPWGSATNTGNNESECYVPGALNETGGALVITATKASVSCGSAGTKAYTSGMIQSHPSFNFTYGYFEMRAKLPGGDAEWPAFWSVPADYSWPPEIDVMEGWGQNHDAAGNLDQIRTTYHWSGGQYGQAVNGVDFSSQWHVFGADWEPGVITWYLDGKQVMQYTGSTVASGPEYLIANLAIDGNSVDAATPTSAQMSIDYIRVWQHG
jgi:beta-glucanase (GH16 family)